MKKIIVGLALLSVIASCTDKDPIIVPDNTSKGKQVALDGNVGSQTGDAAGNSIFVDFSTDAVTPVLRQSWDLGFYCDAEFRVMLNNTTAAMAYVTDQTDMAAVGAADTAGIVMALNLTDLSPALFERLDDIEGDISKTAIPAIHTNDADNKVVIINRGTAGAVAARDFYKVRILRNGADAYTLQYASLDATTFKTITINKDPRYSFQYVSFDDGAITAHPAKNDWDIQWSLAVYKAAFSATEMVPYAFSDLVLINHWNGTQAVEKTYTTKEEAAAAYEAYGKDDLSKETFSSNRWTIGKNWRLTAAPGATAPVGTIKTKFYIVKDHEGNAYKLKFLSFLSEDGGVRGRPEIKYVLID